MLTIHLIIIANCTSVHRLRQCIKQVYVNTDGFQFATVDYHITIPTFLGRPISFMIVFFAQNLQRFSDCRVLSLSAFVDKAVVFVTLPIWCRPVSTPISLFTTYTTTKDPFPVFIVGVLKRSAFIWCVEHTHTLLYAFHAFAFTFISFFLLYYDSWHMITGCLVHFVWIDPVRALYSKRL